MFKFFRFLFHRNQLDQKKTPSTVETAPLSEEQLKLVDQTPLPLNPPQLTCGAAQSIGMLRDHNEDTLYLLNSLLADGNSDLPFGIFIIADGMGGHLNGEIASGAAARAFANLLLEQFYAPFLADKPQSEQESIHEVMEKGVSASQRAVLQKAPGGGTTLTAALVIGDKVTIAHVGDSRAYFIYPDGRIQAITQDHSLVRRLQDLGQINEQEASVHPQRNVLYRALGQNEPFRPDVHTHSFPRPGWILLCSDGLWGSVDDEEMAHIVKNAPNLTMACNQLVAAANAAGGPDNISAVLFEYLS